MLKKVLWTLMGFLVVFDVAAEMEFADKNVNPLFIKSMPGKPWWNDGYKFRAPLLISETVGKKRENIMLDFVCDLGQKISPDAIRIVTPWEEEIPSQVIPLEGNKLEIIFSTSLREYENKPFFIYFGNPEAKKQDIDTDLIMRNKGNSLDIKNEKIQAVFTADNKRSGKIRTFRIIGSNVPNQLTERYTGVTWAGLDLGKMDFSEKPSVKIDGPFKKTIEYSSDDLAVEYTIYSFSPRIDFKLIPKNAKTVSTVTKWLAGGGDAYDNFYYDGLKGPMQFKAGLDVMSDKGVNKIEDLTKWMKDGWAALSDAKVNESVGTFFDREAMKYFQYYDSGGNGGETFTINFDLKKPVSGALLAMKGDWKELRSAYIDWKNPPVINFGNIQPYRKIGYKVPSFTKDFTRDYKFEDTRIGERITENFAEEMVYNIRKLGGNAAKYNIYMIKSIPLSKEVYEKYVKVYEKYYQGKYRQKQPEYNEADFKNTYLEKFIKAAHDKGVAVRSWNVFTPFRRVKPGAARDPETVDFIVEFSKTLASTGIDLLQTHAADEWAHVPPEIKGGAHGGPFWENADVWLDYEKCYVDIAKKTKEEVKKKYPNIPISTLCSTDGQLPKMDFMDEKGPYLDTVENEFCPGMIPRVPQLKYGIKRMQGAFGNDGRSIQHHFYYYVPNPLYRVSEMELPMIFGIKSFSHEGIGHYIKDSELNEITADFYRLTDYTALDKFIAGTTPYKFLGVFRDANAFRDDIRNKRISSAFPGHQGEQEARCKQLTVLKSMPMDLVFNRFFKLDELKKYKIIFIPSDKVFSDEYAKELEEYVKNGGSVISEGSTADNKIFAKLAGVKKTGDESITSDICGIPMKSTLSVEAAGAETLFKDAKGKPAVYINSSGKGKVIYSPYILTDDMNNSKEKEIFVRELVVKIAGTGPIIPAKEMVTAFDSSLLVNGNEYFLGVYNPASLKKLETEIKIDVPSDKNYFLLNVKTGEKTPFTGTVKTDIDPLQTGFYIIGTKAAEIPELKKASPAGGYSILPGMKFLEKKRDDFTFEFTPAGKIKTVGVLHITDKRGQIHAWGAEAVYNCIKENMPGIKVEYLENLKDKTINGCDAVIVPNMGNPMPVQLNNDWSEKIAEFARQGGGVMVMHNSMGIGSLGEPPFPSVAKYGGNYYAVNDFSVVKEHPVTDGMKTGEVFHDSCWDYDQVETGENGIILAKGLRKDGIPTPAIAVGKYGKGNVVVCGIAIGAGYKKEGEKFVKYEAPPEGGLKKILLNSVKWMLSEKQETSK